MEEDLMNTPDTAPEGKYKMLNMSDKNILDKIMNNMPEFEPKQALIFGRKLKKHHQTILSQRNY